MRTLPPASSLLRLKDFYSGLLSVFTSEKEINNLIDELKNKFNVKYIFLLSSGTAALSLLLKSFKQLNANRDIIVVPAYTCYSVYAAIAKSGFKVLPCDVNPQTLDYNYTPLKKALSNPTNNKNMNELRDVSSRILAAISVNNFGLATDINKLRECIPQHVHIIEDAAQAMGILNGNYYLGTTGTAGIFSLSRGKSLTSLYGGIILTNNKELGRILQNEIKHVSNQSFLAQIRLVFLCMAFLILQHPSLFWIPKRVPFLRLGETIYDPTFKIQTLSAFQAGLLRNWQKKLSVAQMIRSRNVSWWHNNIDHKYIHKIEMPFQSDNFPPLLRYPLFAESKKLRDRIIKISNKYGLGIMPVYPGTIKNITDLNIIGKECNYEGAQLCAERLFTLPVHSWVSMNDRKKIRDVINSICNEHKEQAIGFT